MQMLPISTRMPILAPEAQTTTLVPTADIVGTVAKRAESATYAIRESTHHPTYRIPERIAKRSGCKSTDAFSTILCRLYPFLA